MRSLWNSRELKPNLGPVFSLNPQISLCPPAKAWLDGLEIILKL